MLYNLHKVRGLPFWRLRVYSAAEWEAQGVLASYLEMQLSAGQTDASLIEDFRWATAKQLNYDWRKAAAAACTIGPEKSAFI